MVKRIRSLKKNYNDFIDEIKNIYYLLRSEGPVSAFKKFSLSTNPLLLVLNGFPIVLFVGALFCLNFDSIVPENRFWFYIPIITLFLVLLISTRPLQFLGEPERYLEFSTVAGFVSLSIISETLLSNFISIFLFTICFLFAVIVTGFHFYFSKPIKNDSEEDNSKTELLNYLMIQPQSNMLCIPLRLSFLIGYYTQQYKFLNLFSNVGDIEGQKKYLDLVPDIYPYPGRNLSKYVTDYNINFIVFDKSIRNYLIKYESYVYEIPDNFSEVYSNAHYSVFKIA
jgi:hypothetical protein